MRPLFPLIIVWCASGSACVDSQDWSLDANAIYVGGLLPFSGDMVASGQSFERATILAAEQFESFESVVGRPLAVYSADSHARATSNLDIADGLASFGEMVEEVPLRALVGPQNSTLAKRIAGEAFQEDVVHFPGAVLNTSTFSGSCSFQFIPNANIIAEHLARRIYETDGLRNIAVIQSTDDYGSHTASALLQSFRDLGGTVSAQTYIDTGDESSLEPLQGALRGGPDAVVLITYPELAARIVRDSVLITNAPIQWYFSSTLHVSDFLQNVPPGVIENGTGVSPGAQAGREQFLNLYEGRFGTQDVSTEALYYFDATALAILAHARAVLRHGDDPSHAQACQSVRELSKGAGISVGWRQLDRGLSLLADGEEIDYTGVSGQMDFDEFGNLVSGQLEVWRVEDHQFTTSEIISF
jgi:branched-chain amino acid transport system substrate-binding protein